MTSDIPSKIGKYGVIDLIGRGGMGVVYKAKDPHLERPVAIKMMTSGFADNPDLLKRFFREAQSLGSLQHPNIVTVYDLGDYGGNPYLVMEFLEGEGLDSVLTSRRQLSLLEKTSIIVQVCNGLAYAHRRGVVHRDIKPANIMLSQDGSVKIFDFGIAHIGDNSVTKTGQIVGTLSYMSPEQVNGKPVDARTDLFSTGVVLYQLFTNHLPFEGESTATTLLKIIYDPPPPLRNFLTSYPAELEGILLRALAKDRKERYHSADEFALDLGQLQVYLKQELIVQNMGEVGKLLEKSDLYKAREYLVQVLKIDTQHVQATQLLREVQQRIKKEEISEQVRKLRQGAEEAVAREQFNTAEECLEQALALDKNNSDLHRLRDSVRAAALRLQKLHNALKLAESAHQDGDLDTAKQAVEEALQIAPDDTQAKALYRLIQRVWVERSRQRQLENYLFQARQDISSWKFTAALEILKLAEALDPGAPQVHALMESASAGRDQERRRKDLEAITRDIEDALNRDDYSSACVKAEEGLARFPDERTLLKLKALADRQRQMEERKQFIDEQLAQARKLLQESRNEELLEALQAAIATVGPEPRLQSLLTIVTENVERDRTERQKCEYLRRAKESLRNKEFDFAIQTLESARAELKNENEIDDLLQFVREEAAADQRRRTAATAEKARQGQEEAETEHACQLDSERQRETSNSEARAPSGQVSATRVFTPAVGGVREATPPETIAPDLTSSSSSFETPPGSGSTILSSGWREDTLRTVEKQLAPFLGPLAKIIVKKAASKTTDPEQLYALVAASLEREADRQAFLARKVEGNRSRAKNPPRSEPGPVDGTAANASLPVELTPAAIDHAARMLARHVGPLSRVLTKKAAQRADSLRALYLLLAEHLESKTERAQFLRDVGFPEL